MRTGMLAVGLGMSAMLAALPLAAADAPADPWQRVGNDQFRESIALLAGKDAVDCGVVLLVLRKPGTTERRKALDCMAEATKRPSAFRFATSRVPIDSNVDEVYVRTQSGERWLLVYDLMPLENTFQIWLKLCDSVSVDEKTLLISGEKCVETPPWRFVAYDGFIGSVDKLVGAGAIDCGLVNLVENIASTVRREEIAGCVQAAMGGKQPFKYGVIPRDSKAFYVLLRSEAGELWTIRYARDITNKHMHEHQYNQICKHMTFDSGALTFHGLDCAMISDGGLPTYEPNTGH